MTDTTDPSGQDQDRPTGAWSEWLSRTPWTAMTTLTFKYPTHPDRAVGNAREWADRMEGLQSGLPYCAVVETESHVHLHALLALPGWRFLEHLIASRWGHGRVHVHDEIGPGAVRYVARKIVREPAHHLVIPSNLGTRTRKLRRKMKYLERRSGDRSSTSGTGQGSR